MPALVKKKLVEEKKEEVTFTKPLVKFSINREVLTKYLSVLSTASSKIVKASQCVLFTIKDKRLTIKTTNLTLYLKYDHGEIDCPDCSFMLPIDYINPLVSRSESKDVVIEQIDHQRYKITTDGSYTFGALDGIEFPESHDQFEHQKFMKIDAEDLKESFRRVSFAISEDVTKSRYLGVYFDGNFIATNGKHVACIETKDLGKIPELFIPRQARDIVNRFDGEVELGLNSAKQLVIKSVHGNLTAVSSLLVFESFIPYKSLFGRFNHTNNFEFEVKTMNSALHRLGIFVDEFSSGVYCTIDGKNKKLTMTCGKGNNGVEVIDLTSYTGPDLISFIANHTTLVDLMDVIKNKNCKVSFLTENDPFVVEDDNLKFMMSMMVER